MKKYRVQLTGNKEVFDGYFDCYDYCFKQFLKKKEPYCDVNMFIAQDMILKRELEKDKTKLFVVQLAINCAKKKMLGVEEKYDLAIPKYPLMGLRVKNGKTMGVYAEIIQFSNIINISCDRGMIVREGKNHYVVITDIVI